MENQLKALGPSETMTLGPIPCNGAVCIPRTRYDELLRAEMKREILFHAYQIMDSSQLNAIMDAVFNPNFKFKPN